MKIKLLVMDVDGTLTDGCIYTGSNGEMMKAFDVKDGYAIKHILPTCGIIPVIITGRSSEIVAFRAKELGIVELYQGISDKEAVLRQVAQKYSASLGEIAYMGDDVNDLACMKLCGLAACPQDAVEAVRLCANVVCKRNGGHGAVREFIDSLLSDGQCATRLHEAEQRVDPQ